LHPKRVAEKTPQRQREIGEGYKLQKRPQKRGGGGVMPDDEA